MPIVILATMFEKANELLRYEDLIVKKPGADDGSYIVAGHTSQIYCVTPGKGGSFKCDRNCENATTKLCEQTIAVAEKYGKLPDFITWRKRSKSRASIIKMALSGAPKTAGRKLSTRKRSNRKKPSTTSLVDLSEDCNDQLSKVRIKLVSHQCKYLQLILLIILFQIMLRINHVLLNKIVSSHRYKKPVSVLNG